VVLEPDLQSRTEASAELSAQRTIIDSIARGEPLRQTLDRLALAIEGCTEGLLASVLLVEGSRLRVAAGPSLPQEYNRASDGVPVGEGFGSCGTAAYSPEAAVSSKQTGRAPRAAASLLSFVHICESASCDGMRALSDTFLGRNASREIGILAFVPGYCDCRASCHRIDRGSDFKVKPI